MLNMTPEQAKTQIREWFTAPGRKLSKTPTENCYYRYPGQEKTRRCAVGCLIPDELYKPNFEDKSMAAVMIQRELFGNEQLVYRSDLTGLAGFLSLAQRAHDQSDTVEEFLEKLEAIPT